MSRGSEEGHGAIRTSAQQGSLAGNCRRKCPGKCTELGIFIRNFFAGVHEVYELRPFYGTQINNGVLTDSFFLLIPFFSVYD